MLKTCSTCKKQKPLDKFYYDKNKTSSRQSACIQCCRDRIARTCERNRKKNEAATIPSQENKKCSVCGNVMPVQNFHKNKCNFDGYTSQCKECISERVSMRREKRKQGEDLPKEK